MSLMGKVGTRLSVNANYDTQSTFAFQNLMKLNMHQLRHYSKKLK
jgi:cell surface protein SprA